MSEDDDFSPPQRRSTLGGCAFLLRLEALPFPDDIDQAIASAPQAEADLRAWQEAWDRSFPNWWQAETALKILAARGKDEALPEDVIRGDIERFLATPGSEPAITAFLIEKRASSVAPLVGKKTSPEILVARTLRAASAFASFARLSPFVSAINVVIDGFNAGISLLIGHDEDGVSRLARPHARYGHEEVGDPRFDDDLLNFFIKLGAEETAGPQFWTWTFLHEHLGRTVFGVGPTHFEIMDREPDMRRMQDRRIMLAGAIADMAARQHPVAIYTPRVTNSSKHAQLLDISRIETIRSALDLLDNTDRSSWSATVEPLDDYMSVNRYFFYGGHMIGATCVDPTAHPYDHEASNGFDRRLTCDVTGLITDGNFNVADIECLLAHTQYAHTVAALLRDHGIMDYALDVGLYSTGTDADGTIEYDFRVLAVSDLWHAETFSFDVAALTGLLKNEAELYREKLDVSLAALADHPDFGRLAPDFRTVVEEYGREAMIARILQRSSSVYRDAWDEATVRDVLEESVVHFVRFAHDDTVTPSEIEAADDKVSFLRYDGFHEWLWKTWNKKD
jgi:hypothetical protein